MTAQAHVDPATDGPRARVPAVDVARGVAILAMVIYHLSWDLMIFGLVDWRVEDGLGWRIFRTLIAGSFLTLVGVGLVLAARGGVNWVAAARRIGWIAGSAALISVVTYFAIPDTWIFFGILHCIAVVSVLGWGLVRAPLWALAPLALAAFAAPEFARATMFDHPLLSWTGLVTVAPITNDYVPLFPWSGFAIAGIVAARLALDHHQRLTGLWRWGATGPIARCFSMAGRRSLAIYLIHQPILIAFIAAFVATSGAGSWPFGAAATDARMGFETACVAACRQSMATDGLEAAGEDRCVAHCGCLTEQAAAAGLLTAPATEATRATMLDLATACAAQTTGD